MENGEGFDSEKVLEDGVIAGCALRSLSETIEREEQEDRVLNGVLTMVCTYPEGYKERQAIYSCLTCQEETGQVSGICYACSENCHEDHDVIQLYTKRAFCCDCGNSKFKSKCTLFEEKSDVNRKNRYGHNFKSQYCTCEKPYPPPEDDPMFGVDMYQCFMCEDWFHAEHIDAKDKLTSTDDYTEMCCPACSRKYPFISTYHYVCEQDANQQAEASNEVASQSQDNSGNDPNATSTSQFEQYEYYEARKRAPADNSAVENQVECYLEKINEIVPEEAKSPHALIFCNIDWRPMLCRCDKCKRMYETLDCEFLLDEKDSLYVYLMKNANELENIKKDPATELYEEIALRTNADVAHHAVVEIASLKHKLRDFFDQKAKSGDNVITSEDVHTFFGGLTDELAAKRRRLEDPGDEDHY